MLLLSLKKLPSPSQPVPDQTNSDVNRNNVVIITVVKRKKKLYIHSISLYILNAFGFFCTAVKPY